MKRAFILVLCVLVISGCTQTQSNSSTFTQPKATSALYNTPKPAPAQSAATVDPYVGLYVSAVPSAWEWQGTDNTTVKDQSGGKVRTTKYRYDTASKIFVIWVNESDRVVKVSVTEIGAKHKKIKGQSVIPPIDVSDFTDPEDFYEWNLDDFSDYEDAEEYYHEHGGR